MGFDTAAHEQYIRFIQEKHALPLPKDGWEMHQPPLYYAVSALLLDAGSLTVTDNDATSLLRTVNGVVGLGQKPRAMRTVLWVLLLAWVMTAYATFWIRSDNPETHRVRGIYQATQGDYADALVSLSQALQLNPDDAATHCIMAEILNDQSQAVEAVQHYRAALRIRPGFPEALNNLAWLLTTSEQADIKNPADAVPLAERACELTLYSTPDYISTLAAAYAGAGRFDEAMATAEKACALASESGDQNLLKRNQELLELYRKHQPYHEAMETPVPAAP